MDSLIPSYTHAGHDWHVHSPKCNYVRTYILKKQEEKKQKGAKGRRKDKRTKLKKKKNTYPTQTKTTTR
jgi:hypothetical protein